MNDFKAVIDKVRARRTLPRPAERRAIRLSARLSQADLAAALDPPVTRAAVSRWELGEREPTGDHLVQYAALLAELAREVAA